MESILIRGQSKSLYLFVAGVSKNVINKKKKIFYFHRELKSTPLYVVQLFKSGRLPTF